MTIVITGADGQLARVLRAHFDGRARVLALSRADLDITDDGQVQRVIEEMRPTAILNGAAYNDVDGAEDHAAAAIALNTLAVRSLARAARRVGAALVHYSTDFVFDGSASRPYTEVDAPSPQSVYAASKLMGEWMAAEAGRAYVLRVESLFGAAHAVGAKRAGSIDRIIDALEQRRTANVFADRVVSPSYLPDIAAATDALLTGNAAPGVYHTVNRGHATWYELARKIAEHTGGVECLNPVASTSVALKASRPLFAALSSERLAANAYEMPTWQNAIDRYFAFRRAHAAR